LFMKESYQLSPKLLQKTHIVLIKQPDIRDSVSLHRDAGGAHAKGEPGVALGVVADRFENCGIDHPCAHDLHPAGALAGAAAVPLADLTGDVHFRRRFSEREVRWPCLLYTSDAADDLLCV